MVSRADFLLVSSKKRVSGKAGSFLYIANNKYVTNIRIYKFE